MKRSKLIINGLICLGLTFLFFACGNQGKKDTVIKSPYYEKMKFIRTGGGDIAFDLFETEDPNLLKAVVHKYDFRDTTLAISVHKNEQNKEYFNDFHEAMRNNIELTGDSEENKLPTGTWAHLYFVSQNKDYEVTNINVQEKLSYFEKYVRTEIGK
ncbi:hypothetical protein [Fluviicola sp.]|jgi:hypothetical protein|uniref:hypothetical protein n=1 Tax=Fluviicola sp. TaxID=1917219 RepID=UPI002822EB93|nr:hypothetical protein [Fluviicola sp.]MDR0803314.1 hypothetical protein [Fluviicola sp.]